jgi:AraC-like DNA-binding protein
MRRKNLSNIERQAICEALLSRSVNGKMKRSTTIIVANLFNVNRCFVQSLWRIAKECLAEGVQVDVSCKRKNCGRKKVAIDMSRIATIPLNKRTTLRDLAHELGAIRSTLHRCFKQGKIRQHSNTIKPLLREDNKKA